MEHMHKVGDLVYVTDTESGERELGTLIQVIPFREKTRELSFIWYTLVGTNLCYVREDFISKISESYV